MHRGEQIIRADHRSPHVGIHQEHGRNDDDGRAQERQEGSNHVESSIRQRGDSGERQRHCDRRSRSQHLGPLQKWQQQCRPQHSDHHAVRDAGSGRTESGEGDLDRHQRNRQRDADNGHQSDKIGCGGVSGDEERRLSRHDVEERMGHGESGERENMESLRHCQSRHPNEHTLDFAPEVRGTTPWPQVRDTMPRPPPDHHQYTCYGEQPE